MRTVGKRLEASITFNASADLLKKGMRFNDEMHGTFAGRHSGVLKGVYRFRSHDQANAHQVECVAMKMASLTKEARHG